MAEAKLVFLSFETKYVTRKIGPYIKLKLLKSYIYYKKFKTWDKKKMPKKYETTAILKNTANFPSKFKVFVFHLKPQNFYTNYNFLIPFIWYTAHFVTFSISTKNSEKLNQIGFNFPPWLIVPVYL